MSIIHINLHPTNRQLRQFAVIACIAVPSVMWLWGASSTSLLVTVVVTLLVAICGYVWPKCLWPLFLGLSLVAAPIGLVVGELAMLVVYWLVVVPIGVSLRLLNHDLLQLRLDKNTHTYWQSKQPPKSPASYYRQF